MLLRNLDDPALNYAVAKSWSDNINLRMSNIPNDFVFKPEKNSNSKITLGYLSNNFRNHAMGHLMAGLFRTHDREIFNVYCYSCGKDDGSEYRERIQNGCDRFVDIRSQTHLDAARAIYRDEVDILIDLMGYTRGSRMEIAALHPAPVQVRYMGMAGTTGASFFDYLIADRTVVPAKHAQYYSEKLVYMPDCYQINDDRQKIAENIFDRKGQGLPEKGFVFCSFNQAFKIDLVMFKIWMKILKKVPGSVLWLQAGSKAAEKNILKEADNCGIAEERIVFAPKMDKADHLARLKLADLALDTRIVSGAATTSDALWAGIPVITLKGNHFSSRMSASILKAIGLCELVTASLDAYKELAVHLAKNPIEIESFRRRLYKHIKKKNLFNTTHFTTNLEKAYKKIWWLFLNDQTPRFIEVAE
jgi:predicted O-linked N-acetylglucosamine transferase (SPINDLY family)